MRSGDLFLEVSSSNQATALIKLHKLAHLDITVAPHSNLNFSRGVISPADFLNVSTEEIKENMKAQKVCDVRRITIRRDGQVLNTKHLHPDLSTPDLPQTVKMAYIRCPVRPYIPIRCAAFSANDTATRRTSVGANLPALVAGNRATTAQTLSGAHSFR
ncbi:CCHC-type domain-containing protein [Trichonephila clavipes]|nr:CCHC-type domain-containing protein [Trichonephila clavipes]